MLVHEIVDLVGLEYLLQLVLQYRKKHCRPRGYYHVKILMVFFHPESKVRGGLLWLLGLLFAEKKRFSCDC